MLGPKPVLVSPAVPSSTQTANVEHSGHVSTSPVLPVTAEVVDGPDSDSGEGSGVGDGEDLDGTGTDAVTRQVTKYGYRWTEAEVRCTFVRGACSPGPGVDCCLCGNVL